MSIANTLAVVVLCNAAIALIVLLANAIAKSQVREQQRKNNQQDSQGKSQPMPTTGDAPRSDAISTSDGNKPANQKDGNEIPRGEHRFVAWSEVFLGTAIMVATVAQAVIGKFQWDAMAEQNAKIDRQMGQADRALSQTDETLRLMRLEQRPWVGVESASIGPLVAGAAIQCMATMRNSGHAPAFVQSYDAGIVPVQPDVDIGPFIDAGMRHPPHKKENEIAPGATVEMNLSHLAALDADLVKEVEEGKSVLYVFGSIGYTDATGGVYETRFCFQYVAREKKLYRFFHYNKMR